MVSFEMDDEQKMLKDTLDNFATNEVRKAAHDCDENGSIPEELVGKGWELGLIMSNIPEEFGGAGMTRSAVTGSIALEAMAWGDLSITAHLLSPALLAYPILDSGSEEQKKNYLPAFCTETFKPVAAALIEPRILFDPTSLNTTAVREGNDYFLNGEKCFVPLGSQAELFLVFAASNPGIGYAGIDAFVVEKNAYGLEVKDREKNMGLKGLETYEITLTDCQVPAENKLGGEGVTGAYVNFLNRSRVAMTAAATGVARAAFEYFRDYAKDRIAFGEPIASRQAIAFMLAEMAIEVDATRLLAWEAGWRIDRGMECTNDAYLAKRYAQEAVLMVTDRAVQILGGHGYIREHPVEMWLRNGRGFAMIEGLLTV